MTCLAVENQFGGDPLHRVIAKDRGHYSQIVFRKREKGSGLDLTGFDWYVNKEGFGLSIQKPIDAEHAINTIKILHPLGFTVQDSKGNSYQSKWHEAEYTTGYFAQVKFDDLGREVKFEQTEVGDSERANFRAHMFSQFIAQTLPEVKVLVASKISGKMKEQMA